MKVFVWQRIEKCTDSYHTEGGLVVFAESLERAKELAVKWGCSLNDTEIPDDIRKVDGGDEAVFIMADAGCC